MVTSFTIRLSNRVLDRNRGRVIWHMTTVRAIVHQDCHFQPYQFDSSGWALNPECCYLKYFDNLSGPVRGAGLVKVKTPTVTVTPR